MTQLPPDIVSARDYERQAVSALDPARLAFLTGSAGVGATRLSNLSAFEQIRLYNRVFCNVSQGHTKTRILDRVYAHPVFLAPVAYQKLYHAEGEVAAAQAAEATDTCMVLSTLSSTSLEDVASVSASHWFQIYFQANQENTLDLVRRAEGAGYAALVVTADTPIIAPSRAAIHAGFTMPSDIDAANLRAHRLSPPITAGPEESPIFQGAMTTAPTWQDLEWLIAETSLPVFVKGVSHPADARRAVECGASGVIVSTHAGRALDSMPGSIECLNAVRSELGSDIPILFDSGIRSGADVFKAIALGANAVLVGHLQACALAVAGALGVAHMIKLMREELEFTMALTGCSELTDITQDCLHPL